MSLLCTSSIISFHFTTNVRYLAWSSQVLGSWYGSCLVSALKPELKVFSSRSAEEVNFRKSQSLFRCRHSPNVAFERTVIAHVLLFALTVVVYVACFSSLLNHYDGEEIGESFNDELKKITGYFKVGIFLLMSYDLFGFTPPQTRQPRCWVIEEYFHKPGIFTP